MVKYTIILSLLSAICSGALVAWINFKLRAKEAKENSERESKSWLRNQCVVHIERIIEVSTRVGMEDWDINKEYRHVSVMELTNLFHLSEIYLPQSKIPKISTLIDDIINARMKSTSDNLSERADSGQEYSIAKQELIKVLGECLQILK